MKAYTDRYDDRYGGRVQSKKTKTKVAILKIILSLTGCQCLESWSNVSALAKNNYLRCVVLNFLLPVHLITVEQRLAAVQPTENERTHQLSSGPCRQEMAD